MAGPDRQTLEFIEATRSSAGPPPWELSLSDFRAQAESFRQFGFDLEPVERVDQLSLTPAGSSGRIRAKLFRPQGQEPLPMVVWAHGGSWTRMSVDIIESQLRFLANRSGCAIAAVEYQRSPEARFPTAIEEVHAAAGCLERDAEELGLDADRVAIGGESSGGNLAAAACLFDRDKAEIGYLLQVLIIPVLDVGFATDSWRRLDSKYLLGTKQMRWALEQYAPGVSPDDPLLSPLRAPDLTGLPRTIIFTGGLDPLKDEGAAYAARLQGAGVEVEITEVAGMIHHASAVPKLIPRGREMWEALAAALGRAMRDPGCR